MQCFAYKKKIIAKLKLYKAKIINVYIRNHILIYLRINSISMNSISDMLYSKQVANTIYIYTIVGNADTKIILVNNY